MKLEIDKIIEEKETEENLPKEESDYLNIESEINNNQDNPEEISKDSFSDVSVEDFTDTKEFLLDAGKYLLMLGIEVTPKIFSSVYKGILFLMIKIVKLLSFSISKISKFIDRHFNNFNRLKNDISNIKKSISLLEKKNVNLDNSNLVYNNKKIIDKLKINDSVDLINNIKILTSFVNEVIVNIDDRILKDLHLLKHLSDLSDNGITNSPLEVMKADKLSSNFTSNIPAEYRIDLENTISYSYRNKLPGDLLFITRLPVTSFSNIDQIVKSYTSSKIFFGVDSKNYKDINSINYMNLKDLSNLVDELDKLCNLCLSHESKFKNILNENNNLKYNIKHYFLSIININNKISIKDSLIQYYYLKYGFVDKVYLSSCDDIYNYVIAVTTYIKSYISANLDVYLNLKDEDNT